MQLGPFVNRVCRAGCGLLFAISSVGCDQTKPEKVAAEKVASMPGAAGGVEALQPPSVPPIAPADVEIALAAASAALGTEVGPQTSSDSEATRVLAQSELATSPFMTLRPVDSQQPAVLVAFLGQVDSALRDLIIAGSNNIVDSETFTSAGLRLGKMKLNAGEQLAQLPDATAEQRKLATIAQLVALSHMSGLKDVEAAKRLEQFASALMQSSDADLAHQGRVVLLGFRLQDLQNGVSADPEQLLSEMNGLFQRPQDSGFPEMMILQQAQQVLTQMGFQEAANKVDQIVVDKYMDVADVQLSMAAWGIAAANSQAFANYNAALQDVYLGKLTDPTLFLGAARGLYQDLPNASTLLQFANAATDLEYRGSVDIASELGNFVRAQLKQLPPGPYTDGINSSLDAQQRRLAIRGQVLNVAGLVDLEGQPLDWSAYRGKVVLLDFWATWCTPCLREIPNIRQVYDSQNAQGFEVLGINMDDNLTPVRQYLGSNPLPWKTAFSADPSALGFESAIAKELGITAIPFLVLVDREGKVAAIHVRGDKLAPTVQALLSTTLAN